MKYIDDLQELWDAGMEETIPAGNGTAMAQEQQTEVEADELSDGNTQFSIREEDPPKKTGIAYKVFFEKNGKLYPPMVANPGGADTPVGVWLNADVGAAAPPSKTGRLQVKAGGKGTQGGSGSLAFRPGWHLGDIPKASQFNRLNKATGVKELFPYNFVWAECEYAMDVDYQEEAMSYGYNASGKFQHSLAGLPRLPVDGYYHYRTNPDPSTVPWVITGAMKVNKILSRAEVDEILRENGVGPTKWQGPDGEQMEADDKVKQYSIRGSTVTEDDVKSALKWCSYLNAKGDNSHDWNYVPVRTNTPLYLLEHFNSTDIPMVMNVGKVRQALSPDGKTFGESKGHGLSAKEMTGIMGKTDSPEFFSYSNKRGNCGIVVEHNGKGAIVIVAPPRHMNADLIMSKHGGIRTLTVTMFEKKTVDDAIAYLEDDGYTEKPLPAEASGDLAPLRTEGVATDIVNYSDGAVNTDVQYSRQYHEDVRYSTRDKTDAVSVREYLAEMTPKSYMNDTEVELLRRYQTKLKALQEKQRAGLMRLFRHFVHASPAVLPHATPPRWVIGFSLDPIVHGKNHNVMPCIFAVRPCERTKKREMPAVRRMFMVSGIGCKRTVREGLPCYA